MITAAVSRRAQELAERAPFVTATVVRAQHPTSVQAGNVALVRADGTIEGFVGGVCAEHSVRVYSLKAIERRGGAAAHPPGRRRWRIGERSSTPSGSPRWSA
jgi:xanthine/CO dehydrogenase XdhC/CoxF family maturation factor